MSKTYTKEDILFYYSKYDFEEALNIMEKDISKNQELILSTESLPSEIEKNKNKIHLSSCFPSNEEGIKKKPINKNKPMNNNINKNYRKVNSEILNYKHNENKKDDNFFDNFNNKIDDKDLQKLKNQIQFVKENPCNFTIESTNKKQQKHEGKKEITLNINQEIINKLEIEEKGNSKIGVSLSADDFFSNADEILKESTNNKEVLSPDPKIVEIKKIYNINEYLNIDKKSPLWYIYHTVGKSSFGPLETEKIEQMYKKNLLNGESLIRFIDIYSIDDGEEFKYFKLKEVEKNSFLKRIVLSNIAKDSIN